MEFSREIIAILDYLCQRFGIAIDWTSDNVMPYIQDLGERFIQYEIYTSFAWCGLAVAVLAVSGVIWLLATILDKKRRTYIGEVSKVVFFVALVVGAFVCMMQAIDIIECYTLPEKTILEYLQYLMDSATSR